MGATDVAFTGSVPGMYDRYMGPMLFQPYAREIARRALALQPRRVLETAAGTGIVTAALHEALPDAEITATDLNAAMLEVASERLPSGNVQFQPADALDLPFADGAFDLVVCQFGIMFFPDKVRGNAEARRVLREGGRYLLVIWDALERNPVTQVVGQAGARLFPDAADNFLKRVPFGYHDPALIEHDLLAAGFTDIEFETVELRSRSPSARDAALGLVQGTPVRVEIESRGPDALEQVTAAATEALRQFEGPDGIDAPMSAHIVVATK
jgi:ubiquinone/menaquinone biosynthesis C-methylase UbiE